MGKRHGRQQVGGLELSLMSTENQGRQVWGWLV